MNERGFCFEEINTDYVMSKVRRELSEEGRFLWQRLEEERRSRGTPAIESYLRASFEERKGEAERRLQQSQETFQQEIGG